MVGRMPSPRIEDDEYVTTCIGNVPLFFLNVSVLNRPASTHNELRSMLKKAAERNAICRYPCGIIAREDWLPPPNNEVLEEAGLAPMVSLTGMEATELLPPRRPIATLEIRQVSDDATARDLAELNADAYHLSRDLFECICNMRLWHEDSY